MEENLPGPGDNEKGPCAGEERSVLLAAQGCFVATLLRMTRSSAFLR
jgi:hypothetical protein